MSSGRSRAGGVAERDLQIKAEDPTLTANERLARRVSELEEQLAGRISLSKLPLSQIQDRLHQSWQPDGDTLLLPESVGESSLEDGSVTPQKRSEAVVADPSSRVSGASTLLTTSLVTYLSADIETTGRPMVAQFYFVYSNANSGAVRSITVQPKLDGANWGQSRTLYSPLNAGGSSPLTASGVHLALPLPEGSHTVEIQVLASAAASVTINEGELVVFEL